MTHSAGLEARAAAAGRSSRSHRQGAAAHGSLDGSGPAAGTLSMGAGGGAAAGGGMGSANSERANSDAPVSRSLLAQSSSRLLSVGDDGSAGNLAEKYDVHISGGAGGSGVSGVRRSGSGSGAFGPKLWEVVEKFNDVEQLSLFLGEGCDQGKLYGRHVAINALLTDRAGESVELHGTSNAGASGSIFRMGDVHREKWPHVEHTGESETVISATLDEIAAREGFAMPDLLTVDVQGAELLVLRGGKKVLAEAKAVITEASTEKFYEGGVLFGELNAFLREQGFMAMQRPRKHGDILFLRKSLL